MLSFADHFLGFRVEVGGVCDVIPKWLVSSPASTENTLKHFIRIVSIKHHVVESRCICNAGTHTHRDAPICIQNHKLKPTVRLEFHDINSFQLCGSNLIKTSQQ